MASWSDGEDVACPFLRETIQSERSAIATVLRSWSWRRRHTSRVVPTAYTLTSRRGFVTIVSLAPRRKHLPTCVCRRAGGHIAFLLLFLHLSNPATAFASGVGAPMPWDTPLQLLLSNLTGPTARVLILVAIVACGLLWAFTRNEEGLKRLGQIAFGGAIAMGAVALLTSLGFAGAVV